MIIRKLLIHKTNVSYALDTLGSGNISGFQHTHLFIITNGFTNNIHKSFVVFIIDSVNKYV